MTCILLFDVGYNSEKRQEKRWAFPNVMCLTHDKQLKSRLQSVYYINHYLVYICSWEIEGLKKKW